MDKGVIHIELVRTVERLLRDIEKHSADYHHITPPSLLKDAQDLLRRWKKSGAGGGGPQEETHTEDTKGRS
jgi:hypothetical protein